MATFMPIPMVIIYLYLQKAQIFFLCKEKIKWASTFDFDIPDKKRKELRRTVNSQEDHKW